MSRTPSRSKHRCVRTRFLRSLFSHPIYVLTKGLPTHLLGNAQRASIEANSVYGAMHALESFSQLVDRGSLVNGTVIVDKPRYAFRAVMIDTARHWYHKTVIFQHLDAMAYAKMNVLHWVRRCHTNSRTVLLICQ